MGEGPGPGHRATVPRTVGAGRKPPAARPRAAQHIHRERLTKLFRIRAAWRLTFWRASSSHRRCASSRPTRIVPPGSPRAPAGEAAAALAILGLAAANPKKFLVESSQ